MKKLILLTGAVCAMTIPLSAQTWGTFGNIVTKGQYIGTNNDAAMDMRTNALSRMIIDGGGGVTVKGFIGTGNRLVQTNAAGLITPFNMSTAANVLCGDGAWRPLNNISSSQWTTSGSHLFNANTGSVGIGVNPTSLTDAAKLNINSDVDKVSLYAYSNHTTDLNINSAIRTNRDKAIALAIQSDKTVTETSTGIVHRWMPLTIYGNGQIQFSLTSGYVNAGQGKGNPKELISIKEVMNPITNYNPNITTSLPSNFSLFEDGSITIQSNNYKLQTGYLLAVGGKILCEELVVKLRSNWPDYVFAKDYQLKDINELDAYIQANKHLPNIPSAKEIADKGFETGDIIKRQMEKIEELSLYIIQQHKLIAEQKQLLDKQSTQNIEQDKRLQLLEAKMK